jgi:hypothetical protein
MNSAPLLRDSPAWSCQGDSLALNLNGHWTHICEVAFGREGLPEQPAQAKCWVVSIWHTNPSLSQEKLTRSWYARSGPSLPNPRVPGPLFKSILSNNKIQWNCFVARLARGGHFRLFKNKTF